MPDSDFDTEVTYWAYAFISFREGSIIPIPGNSVAISRSEFFPYADTLTEVFLGGKKGVIIGAVQISKMDYERLRTH